MRNHMLAVAALAAMMSSDPAMRDIGQAVDASPPPPPRPRAPAVSPEKRSEIEAWNAAVDARNAAKRRRRGKLISNKGRILE